MTIKVPGQSSLDGLCLRDESFQEQGNLADPEALVDDIIEGLIAAKKAAKLVVLSLRRSGFAPAADIGVSFNCRIRAK
ncbi:MAG TPA: hypothetical protein VGA09_18500 [Candidatus Binatia bacterium]